MVFQKIFSVKANCYFGTQANVTGSWYKRDSYLPGQTVMCHDVIYDMYVFIYKKKIIHKYLISRYLVPIIQVLLSLVWMAMCELSTIFIYLS